MAYKTIKAIMKIIHNLEHTEFPPTVVTIGSFDGVHRGHIAMIEETRQKALHIGIPVTLLTFASHPRLLFEKNPAPFLLSSPEERIIRLAETGVERCVILDFNKELASMTAREFMSEILAKKINTKMLVLGYNHRFGHPTEGVNENSYIEYGHESGIEVVRAARYEKNGMKTSSSQIRRVLEKGDVETAAVLLGYDYSFTGTVIHGAALGRELGFPTANILPEEPMQLLPMNGVYECYAVVDEKKFTGVMNIGVKPTVTGEGKRSIELFIIDFDGNIYNHRIKVFFKRRLRDEQCFASLDELKAQIAKDVNLVRK